MKTNIDDAAFPIFDSYGEYSDAGLTKREYFAVRIMAALIVEKKYLEHSLPIKAVQLADELIKELNEKNS